MGDDERDETKISDKFKEIMLYILTNKSVHDLLFSPHQYNNKLNILFTIKRDYKPPKGFQLTYLRDLVKYGLFPAHMGHDEGNEEISTEDAWKRNKKSEDFTKGKMLAFVAGELNKQGCDLKLPYCCMFKHNI